MRTELIKPVKLNDDGLKRLARLLTYSWTSEFSVAIDIMDVDQIKIDAISRIYIDAFNAVSLSNQAVMLTLGYETHFTLVQHSLVSALFHEGFYQKSGLSVDFLSDLLNQKCQAQTCPQAFYHLDIYQEQLRLIQLVNRVATANETHIAEEIGLDAYQQLIEEAPSYVKHEGFWNRTDGIIDALMSKEEVAPC
jgi:hypothetical protein